MGADHREYWYAMTGWSLRSEFKPRQGAEGEEAMKDQLYNLAFWYWLYDRICELGDNGSMDIFALRNEWYAQFGVIGDKLLETFEKLLETQEKLKRISLQRSKCKLCGFNKIQPKLRGMRGIEARMSATNVRQKSRVSHTRRTTRDTDTDTRHETIPPTPLDARISELSNRAIKTTGEKFWKAKIPIVVASYGFDAVNAALRDVEAAVGGDNPPERPGALLQSYLTKLKPRGP